MRQRRPELKLRRRGFVVGVFGAALFIAYKALKYPGSIERGDALLCLVLVLSSGLVGGMMGRVLGKIFGPSDQDNGRGIS